MPDDLGKIEVLTVTVKVFRKTVDFILFTIPH